jgi:hypothetical protein
MSMKLLAIAAMTLGMASATPSFAQSTMAPAANSNGDCTQALAGATDNTACNGLSTDKSTTGSVTAPAAGAMAPNGMAPSQAGSSSDCPTVATAGATDNKNCTGLQQ